VNNYAVATEQPTEAEVRALRDQVYGHPATDRCWDACGKIWMQPENLAWLKLQAESRASGCARPGMRSRS